MAACPGCAEKEAALARAQAAWDAERAAFTQQARAGLEAIYADATAKTRAVVARIQEELRAANARAEAERQRAALREAEHERLLRACEERVRSECAACEERVRRECAAETETLVAHYRALADDAVAQAKRERDGREEWEAGVVARTAQLVAEARNDAGGAGYTAPPIPGPDGPSTQAKAPASPPPPTSPPPTAKVQRAVGDLRAFMEQLRRQ